MTETPAGAAESSRTFERMTGEMRAAVRSGATRDEASRRRNLHALLTLLNDNETRLLDALRLDLGKPQFEGYGSEIGLVKAEIVHALAELRDWMRPRHVPTPLSIFPSRSRIHPEPKGLVLILSPWNYPLQLCLDPLVAALAAGNAAIIKPSEWAKATSNVIAELIPSYLPEHVVRVVTGDAEQAQLLLEQRFDHIFFTGSSRIGRLVAIKAAEQLTPVTLELGGKSPVLVDSEADLGITAKRVTWGKFWNAGQSCVAPDYLLVPSGDKLALVDAIKKRIRSFFGDDPATSDSYGRIVSERHFGRLVDMIDRSDVISGGSSNRKRLYIEPTLIEEPGDDHPAMREEIFGPILPVIAYDSVDEAKDYIARTPDPLALYVFSKRKEFRDSIISELPFGGGCVNDTLVHFASPWLPFGGRGASGHGNYHGRHGFDTFSHLKAVVESPALPDIPIRYPPYAGKLRWLKWFMP